MNIHLFFCKRGNKFGTRSIMCYVEYMERTHNYAFLFQISPISLILVYKFWRSSCTPFVFLFFIFFIMNFLLMKKVFMMSDYNGYGGCLVCLGRLVPVMN